MRTTFYKNVAEANASYTCMSRLARNPDVITEYVYPVDSSKESYLGTTVPMTGFEPAMDVTSGCF